MSQHLVGGKKVNVVDSRELRVVALPSAAPGVLYTIHQNALPHCPGYYCLP